MLVAIIFSPTVYLLFRPECLLSSDCELRYACVNQKCADPCPGTCGANAECKVSTIKIYYRYLARHFNYNGEGLSSGGLSMQSLNYPFFLSNDLHQSGNRIVTLFNCGILIPLFQFYSRISFGAGMV